MKASLFALLCLVLAATALGQSWQNGPQSPFGYCRFDGEFFPGTNRVYFLGGRIGNATTLGRIWSYAPDSGTYQDMGINMPKVVSNYDICLLEDDYNLPRGDTFGMYIVGGRYDLSPYYTDTVQAYYPVTNTARKLDTDLFPGRAGGQITVAQSAIEHGNRMWVMGGFSQTGNATSAETWLFDPLAAAGTRWTRLQDMILARAYPIVARVDSFLFALGGDTWRPGPDSLFAQVQCQRFNVNDTASGWSLVASLPAKNGQARAFGFDSDAPYEFASKIVVAGRGVWPNESAHCYIYDVETDSWSSFPSLAQRRRNHAGVLIPNIAGGRGVPGIWVFGGRQNSDTNCLRISEYYQLQLVGQEEPARRTAAGFWVSPNPSHGAVTVTGSGRLRVYDILGTEVWTGEVSGGRTEIRGLATGTYVLRLEERKGIAERRLVVAR